MPDRAGPVLSGSLLWQSCH